MKLALIGPARPYRGGIAQYNTQLFFHLREKHEVLLVNFSRQYPAWLFPGRTQFEEPVPETVGERCLDSLNPLSWRRSARRIRDFRPAVALLHWWHPFFGFCYRSLLKSLRGESVRRLLLCHNVYPHERFAGKAGAFLERRILRSVFREVDGFITQASGMTEEIRDLGAPAEIRQVLHPCYTQFGTGRNSDRDSGPQSPLRLLFFGNIRPYKGLDVLIRALAQLPSALDWELRVAGEFYDDELRIRRMAVDLRVDERIQWESRYIPDREVAEHFRWASVLVAPYRSATQSGVIPVAYQFDLPVITSQVGGLPEVVQPRRTGLLVPPADPSALAAAIDEFAHSRGTISWSKNVRELRSRLSWNQVEDAILSFSGNVPGASPG